LRGGKKLISRQVKIVGPPGEVESEALSKNGPKLKIVGETA
jgi:hypothetical protein